ncbi:MAG: hypothetical protein SWQ30_04560 [Thermodesulfobacteriota bacterium]|nr:hypothetical protein [Thermodesulfobacteriota bacterium]
MARHRAWAQAKEARGSIAEANGVLVEGEMTEAKGAAHHEMSAFQMTIPVI